MAVGIDRHPAGVTKCTHGSRATESTTVLLLSVPEVVRNISKICFRFRQMKMLDSQSIALIVFITVTT